MSKKRTERRSKTLGEAIGFKNIFNNEKTNFLIGILLFGIAIYIIIAMSSYFSTGRTDQSILEDLHPGEWLNGGHQFANYCGSFGAILANFLIKVNFGFAAFMIPAFLILVSMNMIGAYKVNLLKWFLGTMIIMIWCSVTFAKCLSSVMEGLVFNPGGDHGLFCVQQIENLIGPPGLIFLLVLVALAFLTYLSAETITFVQKALNPVKYLTDKVKITVTNLTPNEQDGSEPAMPTPSQEEHSGISGASPREIPLTTPSSDIKVKENEAKEEPSIHVDSGKEEDPANGNTVIHPIEANTQINPREPFTKYKYPTLDLLKKYDNDGKPFVDMDEINANSARITEVLKSFGVVIRDVKATVGPTITLYEITPAEGVRISKIKNLEDDIALSLSALGIRIIAPIPGKGTIGIEVPNKKANIVSMESILNSRRFQDTNMELPIALGKTITNEVYMADLAKIPHLLVAGATGQGKSVGLNAIITSLLYKKHPNELKIVLIDPKKVEFSVYAPIADHFMATLPENEDEPIITDVTKVVRTLNSLCTLMDKRYDLLRLAKVRNIKEYNKMFVNRKLELTQGHDYMPYIVIIIDEFGDLIMTAGKEIEKPICRIAQLARAVGIHMVIATQRPTTNIITGTIKANFPGRMAFKVSAMIDSRTILDRPGANQLIGRGDMLFLNGNDPERVQCAFVDTPEVERINKYIESQPGPVEPMELPEPTSEDGGNVVSGGTGDMGTLDPYFEEAARSIVTTQQGSTSMIQRRFSIGYNRAGRLMDQLEKTGIVGPAQGSKPRDVLVVDETQLNTLLMQLKKQ